ncbi:hypothetical protein ACLBXM_17035 [Xanthobacteraceae bacterium A53D]
MSLREAFEYRYPEANGRIAELRERLIAACQAHIDTGLGDRNTEQRLCSRDDQTFRQQLAEVLIADQMKRAGLEVFHQKDGPDFYLEHGSKRIWIEVITPTPSNVPHDWLAPPGGGAIDLPHEELLLRWTAAIKEKAEKLLGNDHGAPGYLASRVVPPGDAYVIAISPYLLRGYGGMFDCIDGISQFPFAVEATLAVGPVEVRIDRETLEASTPEHQRRMLIPKPRGKSVPADTFLDTRFAPVSAVWAIDVDERALLGKAAASAVVHNPLASSPLPLGLLPALEEFVARPVDDDHYQLDRVDGLTAIGERELS